MEKAFQIARDYSGDVARFNEWFATDLEKVKENKVNFYLITLILRKLRMTQGLVDSVDFMGDIYDKMGLGVDFINIGHIKPFSISTPWINRIRSTPFNPAVDKIFDYSLPARNCLLNISLKGVHPTSNIKWVDPKELVTEEEKFKKLYGIEEDTFMPEGAYLVQANQACIFDNRFNPDHLYFIQVGFENNPTYDEVKAKFQALA
jgi:hypothetical protein